MQFLQICSPAAFKSFQENSKKRKRESCDETDLPSVKRFTVSNNGQQKRQNEVTSAIVKYVITAMRPVAEIENEGFVDLLSTLVPTYHPPDRKVFRSQVLDRCGSVVKFVQSEIGAAMYCAGQADIWSSRRMHGYFGMAFSYIHDIELKTRVVACIRFVGSHTGERIADMFSKVICDFDAKDKVCGLVTDNAANMVTAFKVSPSTEPDVSVTDANDKDNFPKLYKLHLKHHFIPATSAAMERCFSSAGYIANARRSRLADDMLEGMLLAKCNKDFL